MNKVFSFLLVLLVSAGFIASSKNQMIKWSKNKPLSWTDFKGKVPADAHTDANTAYHLKLKTVPKNDSVAIILFAWFDKNASWVKKGKTTPELLAHEQYHFDIAEWHARKLRVKLKLEKFTAKNFNQKVSLLLQTAHSEMEEMRMQYDVQTNHSRITDKQQEWEKKISAAIESYKAGADTLVRIKLLP